MAQVPSNLIPVSITQLPEAPVASGESLLLIVYQGNNYKISAEDLLQVSGVPTTRQVIAGTGMTGGGQLSSNVTLSIASKGVNGSLLSDTGVAAGQYGSSSTVPVITVDATGRVTAASSAAVVVTGYVPVSREVIAGAGLSGGGPLNADVTLTARLADSAPLQGDGAGGSGTSEEISRADHQHPAVDLSVDAEVDGLLGLSNGGTAKSLTAEAGAIVWSGADGLYIGGAGIAGQVLVSGGSGEYAWGSIATDAPIAANYAYIGPTTGANASPTFRALVNADVPSTLTGKTYNGITPTSLGTGWKVSGGTAAVEVSFIGGAVYSVSGTNGTAITLPASTGTVALNNQQFYIGTTQVAINRTSGSLSLTGVNIDGSAASATNATNAANIGVTDDTTTNAEMYPVWVTTAAGNVSSKVSSTRLSFNPSTGVLTATGGVSGGTF